MNPQVLRRFVILLALLTFGMFIFWDVLDDVVERAPGDYHTEMGSNRLVDGLFEEALDHFAQALDEAPDHRGALMGRALVFIRSERYDEAIAELDYLIEFLHGSLEPDDTTGRGVLAAAYANRGIVRDRLGAYELAVRDYAAALQVDEEAVSGPGVVDQILFGSDYLSTVRERAEYLISQLKLPEEERVMRIPEIDAKQRMHKP